MRSQLVTITILLLFILITVIVVHALDPSIGLFSSAEINEAQNFVEEDSLLAEQDNNEPQEIPKEVEDFTELQLARVVHDQSIDDAYIQEYLRQRNDFRTIPHEVVTDSASVIMRNGNNVREDIKGFALNNELYGIHLITCDEEFQACYFRVNGVPTGKMVTVGSTQGNWLSRLFGFNEETKFFSLDNDFEMVIKNIKFNDCGERRFCDIYWDVQDIVEVEIKRK